MKKIIAILLFVSLFFFGLGQSFAIKKDAAYYKTISLTNTEIINIFGNEGKRAVDYLDSLFLEYRADENKVKLREMRDRVTPILNNLQNKPRLSRNEQVVQIVAENIYARSSILLEYLLN